MGYFCLDVDSVEGKFVFNCIVGFCDIWVKIGD